MANTSYLPLFFQFPSSLVRGQCPSQSPITFGRPAIELHRRKARVLPEAAATQAQLVPVLRPAAAAAAAAPAVLPATAGVKRPRQEGGGGAAASAAPPLPQPLAAADFSSHPSDYFPPCQRDRPVFWTYLTNQMPAFAFWPVDAAKREERRARCPNQGVVEQLEALLANARQNLQQQDVFRVRNYQLAISTVRSLPLALHPRTAASVLHKRPGCGKETVAKVLEMLTAGGCARLRDLETSEQRRGLNDLRRIWGVGPATAQALQRAGINSVQALRAAAAAAAAAGQGHPGLTPDSLYCLGILDDLEVRIPRAEVQEMLAVVAREAEALWGAGSVTLTICGSYRRGKATCGDGDILISPSAQGAVLQVEDLVARLRGVGFVTRKLKEPVEQERGRGRPAAGGGGGGEEEEEGGEFESEEEDELDWEGGGEEEEAAAAAAAAAATAAAAAASPTHPSRQPTKNQAFVTATHSALPGTPYSAHALPLPLESLELLPHPPAYYQAQHSSAMTVCKLPGAGRLHRRLDLKVYPRATLPFALLYFTGSDYYNRSLRNFCNRSGWTLSDHGLCKVSARANVLLRNGKMDRSVTAQSNSVRCANEADVLRAIGAPWMPPSMREL